MKSNKGAAFEREFSKQLSLWWSDGGSKDVFWRTPMSGGKATVDQRSTHAGDIRAVLPEGEGFTELFNVELKCGYPNADFQRILDGAGEKHEFLSFIEQAKRDNQLAGSKYWMLVIKRDRKKPLVVLDMACWSLICPLLLFEGVGTPNIEMEIGDGEVYAIFRLEDLFKLDPSQVYEALR